MVGQEEARKKELREAILHRNNIIYEREKEHESKAMTAAHLDYLNATKSAKNGDYGKAANFLLKSLEEYEKASEFTPPEQRTEFYHAARKTLEYIKGRCLEKYEALRKAEKMLHDIGMGT